MSEVRRSSRVELLRRLAAGAAISSVKQLAGRWHRLETEGFGWPPTAGGRRERATLLATDDLDGPLTRDERRAIYAVAAELSADGDIVELSPWGGQVTACLARACVGTDRRVHAVWSEAAIGGSDAERYRAWHHAVLRKHLVPQVVPVVLDADRRGTPPLPDTIALLVCVGGEGSPVASLCLSRADRVIALQGSTVAASMTEVSTPARRLRLGKVRS